MATQRAEEVLNLNYVPLLSETLREGIAFARLAAKHFNELAALEDDDEYRYLDMARLCNVAEEQARSKLDEIA